MSVWKGKKITVEIFGESHAPFIGAKVGGMPKFRPNYDELQAFCDRRKPHFAEETARRERDIPIFEGVSNGIVCGDFSFIIENNDIKTSDYNELYGKPRPSHADYARYLKDGTLDFRGGGAFSGRMTAPLCVVGGICKQFLASKGIFIEGYVRQVGSVVGLSYKTDAFSTKEIILRRDSGFPSLSRKEEMVREIASARAESDSVGGAVECVVEGNLVGWGDCLFDGLEGAVAPLLFAIPAVKGVEFGDGFAFCGQRGSEANDELRMENGAVRFCSNRSGGVNGGVSNGQPLTMSVAFRPTPSIGKEQRTVDLVTGENATVSVRGRHDGCIVARAVPCVESAVAVALTDLFEVYHERYDRN